MRKALVADAGSGNSKVGTSADLALCLKFNTSSIGDWPLRGFAPLSPKWGKSLASRDSLITSSSADTQAGLQ